MVELSPHEEKRQHSRYSVKFTYDFWDTPDAVEAGVVTDISEVGLGIRSTHKIQIGAELMIRLCLSKEEHSSDGIEGTGRIIWRTAYREQDWKGYRYGMYIVQMSSPDRDRLNKYLLMLQEEESSSH